MKLYQDHIQELYKFTKAHYVEHYDLQTELVDHLANGIEQQWQKHPSLSFEEAKQREFKKFGVFGFMEVVEERRKAMRKKYRAILWSYFREWWSFPKIIGTLSAISIIFIGIRALPSGDVKFIMIAAIFLAFSILMFSRVIHLRRKMEGLGNKWLLQEIIHEQGNTFQYFTLPIHFMISVYKSGFLENTYGQLFIAMLMVQIFIMFKILTFTIPSKAEDLLAKTYPEYKFQQKV